MVAFANLTDNVVFIGSNKIFQIWEPAAGARRIAEAKLSMRSMTLRNGQAA
jgi:MraZ protein